MDFESGECCRFASHVRIISMFNVVCDAMLLSTVSNASAMVIQNGDGQIAMSIAQWFGYRFRVQIQEICITIWSNQKQKAIDQIHHAQSTILWQFALEVILQDHAG